MVGLWISWCDGVKEEHRTHARTHTRMHVMHWVRWGALNLESWILNPESTIPNPDDMTAVVFFIRRTVRPYGIFNSSSPARHNGSCQYREVLHTVHYCIRYDIVVRLISDGKASMELWYEVSRP